MISSRLDSGLMIAGLIVGSQSLTPDMNLGLVRLAQISVGEGEVRLPFRFGVYMQKATLEK